MKRLLTALALAGAAGLLLWGWTARTEASAHIPPGTQPVDLAPLLRGAQPAPQTEALLFQQTGLGPTGLYAVWRQEGAQGVLAFQRRPPGSAATAPCSPARTYWPAPCALPPWRPATFW